MSLATSPAMSAGAALASAFGIEERTARLVGALLKARGFISGLQHPADPEARDLLAEIDRTLGREPRIAYRGWWVSYDPPPIGVRCCDWQFHHDDFDGAEDSGDSRCGSAGSLGEALAEIDEREAE